MAPSLSSLFFLSISLLLFSISWAFEEPCPPTLDPYPPISTGVGVDKASVNSAISRTSNCISQTASLAKFLHQLQKKYRGQYESNALRDCHELLLDGEGLMKDSINALKQYKKDGSISHVGDAQAWLSAGLTDIDTCYDEIKDSSSAELKDEIGSKMDDVEKSMGITLSLVNDLRT